MQIRAHRLEEELSELRKVNGEMRERLGAVNGEIARVTAAREAPSTEGEGEGEGEAVVKLKQRVYQVRDNDGRSGADVLITGFNRAICLVSLR